MRILIADDNAAIRMLVHQILLLDGHTVTLAENGLEALQRALAERPDLIILDGSMPAMDGWETCRRIKEHVNVPVMMLTVHAEKADLSRADSCGADAFLSKPFDVSALQAQIQRFMSQPI